MAAPPPMAALKHFMIQRQRPPMAARLLLVRGAGATAAPRSVGVLPRGAAGQKSSNFELLRTSLCAAPLYENMCMYTYVCIHRSACIHNCIYMRIYTHIYAYVNGMCMYVCAHVHVRASTPPGKAHAGRAVSVSSPQPAAAPANCHANSKTAIWPLGCSSSYPYSCTCQLPRQVHDGPHYS